jgi:excisionase family DNA binding protein
VGKKRTAKERDAAQSRLSDLMTLQEAAAFCRKDPRTLYRWIRMGKIPYRRTPGGEYQFRRSELEAWWRVRPGTSVDQAVGSSDEVTMLTEVPASPSKGRPVIFETQKKLKEIIKEALKNGASRE